MCGVLESLEQEYRREEDWCGGGDRQPEQLMPLINKHMEQKEAFLKVRRTGEALEGLDLPIQAYKKVWQVCQLGSVHGARVKIFFSLL